MPTDLDEMLRERAQRISRALEIGAEEIDPVIERRARADLTDLAERLRLGVGRTVVSLVGGTGSGKSSLFNAISGLDFADVGAIRPTTERTTACVWGGSATDLLDVLDVPADRRIGRESLLDADHERDLDGLVLIDTPDHDSIAMGHALQLERLLPRVDLLVWVVDPQKYADHVLHERYLRAMVDRQSAMLVLVNQIDTIAPSAVDAVVDSVRELLATDGLDQVRILPTSARTGEGIDAVRDVITQVVAEQSMLAETIASELDAIAARVIQAFAADEPELVEESVSAVVDSLVEVSGAPSVADTVRGAVTSRRGRVISAAQRPAVAPVAAVHGRWLDQVRGGLPVRWQRAVADAVVDSRTLTDRTAQAISGIERPSVNTRSLLGVEIVGALLTMLGLALTILLGIDAATDELPLRVAPLVAGAVATFLGATVMVAVARRRRALGEALATAYLDDVRAALEEVVDADLVQPVSAVIARHRQARELLEP